MNTRPDNMPADAVPYNPHANLPLEDRRRRLVFRSWHRGIKELDLIFGNFVEKHKTEMTLDDIIWFEALFEENDHELFAWVTGEKTPPVKFTSHWMEKLQKLNFMSLRAR